MLSAKYHMGTAKELEWREKTAKRLEETGLGRKHNVWLTKLRCNFRNAIPKIGEGESVYRKKLHYFIENPTCKLFSFNITGLKPKRSQTHASQSIRRFFSNDSNIPECHYFPPTLSLGLGKSTLWSQPPTISPKSKHSRNPQARQARQQTGTSPNTQVDEHGPRE